MKQSVEGAQTPYEVYCFRCQVTFPVETRRCLHCGGQLGQRSEAPLARLRERPERPGEPTLTPPEDAGEELEGTGLLMRRFGGLAIWALLALSAVLSNLCRG